MQSAFLLQSYCLSYQLYGTNFCYEFLSLHLHVCSLPATGIEYRDMSAEFLPPLPALDTRYIYNYIISSNY